MNQKFNYSLFSTAATLFLFCTSCGKEEKAIIPEVSTSEIFNITASTASSGGNVTDDGGTPVITRGVCWSTCTPPTIEDNKTTDGAGAGSYSSIITGLEEGMTYYVRAYAINEAGVGYGNQITYTSQFEDLSKLEFISTQLSTIQQVSIVLLISDDKKVMLDWGNGTIETIVGTGSSQTKLSNYLNSGVYLIELSGDLDCITEFYVNSSTVKGDIEIFNVLAACDYLRLAFGDWVGDIGDLTIPVKTSLNISYISGTYGDIGSLPSTMAGSIVLYGKSLSEPVNYWGSIENLPKGIKLIGFEYIKDNQITGNFNTLVNLRQIDLTGLYATGGDMDIIGPRLRHFCIGGTGQTWKGSINSFTASNLSYISFNNMPNVTGNIETLGSSLKTFNVAGSNNDKIYGNISHLPSGLTTLGLTTMGKLVTGHIENLPSTLSRIIIVDVPNVIYNGGNLPGWILNSAGIIISNSWSTSMIDSFLLNAALHLPATNFKAPIRLNYPGMGARTTASDSAVATLISKGYIVQTNK